MNDNPGGAPVPATPEPAQEPTNEPAQNVVPVTPAERQPSIEELAAASVATETSVADTETVAAAETEVAAAAEAKPKKKRKTGIIIAIGLILLAAVAAIVAVLALKPFESGSKLETAISDLVENGAPKLVSLTGTITVTPKVESTVSDLVVEFDSGINNRNGENFTKATITANFVDGREFSFGADEIHTANGDLYLKLTRVADQFVEYVEPSSAELLVLLDSIGVLEAIDDEWILIPNSDFSNLTDIFGLDTSVVCLTKAAGELGEFTDNFAAEYNASPFLVYSEGNIPIAQKNNTLYRIGFDNSKLTSFINNMENRGFINSLLACTKSGAISDNITVSEVEEIASHFPEIYVEVDDNDRFTRIYLDLDLAEATVVADAAIGYPASVTIDEPELYIAMNSILERLLKEFYSGVPLERAAGTE